MFELIRQDFSRAVWANQGGASGVGPAVRELFNPGTQAVLLHRFGSWVRRLPVPVVKQLLAIVHFVLEAAVAWRCGIFIPVRAEIGPGVVIHTWGGGIFFPRCKVGRNLTLVGGGVQFDYLTLSVGDDCEIAPGTKFVGKLHIGNRVRTAPNSVVTMDVPDDSLAFGNPARIVPMRRWKFAPTSGARAQGAAPPPAP